MSAPAVERLRAPDARLGLFATVAIVVGGIVGTGIFTVPAAIADYGWLSVPAFAGTGAQRDPRHRLIAFDATGDPLALFTTLALLSTFVYVYGYVLSVAAELCHSLARSTRDGPPAGTLAIAAIALAMVFSVWMAGATGAEAVQRGTVLILIDIPVYVVTRRTNPSHEQGMLSIERKHDG